MQEQKENASLPPPDFSEFLMNPEPGFAWKGQFSGFQYVHDWKPIDNYNNHPNYKNRKQCAHQHTEKLEASDGPRGQFSGDLGDIVVCKSCLEMISSNITWMH